MEYVRYFPLWCLVFWACGNDPELPRESYKFGRIVISADESYKPVIEQARVVYEASYPQAKLSIVYKPYGDCLADFYNDSVRLVLVPTPPTAAQEQAMVAKLGFKPSYARLLYDAIAIVLNKHAADSILTVPQLCHLLAKSSRYTPVFDGQNTSSTMRYVLDSLLHTDTAPARWRAADSSRALIDLVRKTPNILGILGVCWIANTEDTLQTSFLPDLTVAALQSRIDGEQNLFVRPYLANIATERYPLTRALWYVLKENYSGLGRGFVNFLSNERGQLLFKRAYVMPARVNFRVRKVKITKS